MVDDVSLIFLLRGVNSVAYLFSLFCIHCYWFAFVYYALVFVWGVLQLFELTLVFVCVVYIGYLIACLLVLTWFVCCCLSGWILFAVCWL